MKTENDDMLPYTKLPVARYVKDRQQAKHRKIELIFLAALVALLVLVTLF